MAVARKPGLNPRCFRLKRWRGGLGRGRLRIPHFQRSLRWQREDVIDLFDSIVRGYPVGSLVLWRREASAETVQLGALRVAAPQLTDALWVIDGQQRILAWPTRCIPTVSPTAGFGSHATFARRCSFPPLGQLTERSSRFQCSLISVNSCAGPRNIPKPSIT